MTSESEDPTVIRSIAVKAEDLVAALESAQRGSRDAVLRVTPPFSGRMRARLHVDAGEEYDDPEPIHIVPDALVSDAAPAYPTPAETEDALRADPTVEYSPDRHHDRHTDAVSEWRAAISEHVTDSVSLDTPGGSHTVSVSLLG